MLLLAIAGAALLGLRYAETAGLSKLPGIERAYALVTRYAAWLGVDRRHHTPYEQASELSQRAPNAQEPVQRITDLYVERVSRRLRTQYRWTQSLPMMHGNRRGAGSESAIAPAMI